MKKNYIDSYGFEYTVDDDRFVISRDNLRKLDPTVFEKAASRIDTRENDYSCYAIEAITGNYFDVHKDAFKSAFSSAYDENAPAHPFWSKAYNIKRKQARMTSLAMMATLVRDAKASRGAKKPKASHE